MVDWIPQILCIIREDSTSTSNLMPVFIKVGLVQLFSEYPVIFFLLQKERSK